MRLITRFSFCLMLLLVVATLGAADPAVERKVRDALQPTAPEQVKASVAAALVLAGQETCGRCLPEDVARAKAAREGKPLVLFVGDCRGLAKELCGVAVAGQATEYARDGRPAEERRVVVLIPAKGDEWTIQATLGGKPTIEQIRAALPK